MGNPHCKWVRDRLPLLAGEELTGLDRRWVERHLIGCAKCRQQHQALNQTIQVLQSAAATSPVRADAPSLWPALERQIRESRRPAKTSAFPWLQFGLQPALGVGLGLLCVAVIVVGARRHGPEGPARVVRTTAPVAAPAPVPGPAIPAGEVVSAAESPDVAKPPAEAPAPVTTTAIESVPATQLGFDLDHATPMRPEPREGKQATY
jgi:hypothetical protein